MSHTKYLLWRYSLNTWGSAVLLNMGKFLFDTVVIYCYITIDCHFCWLKRWVKCYTLATRKTVKTSCTIIAVYCGNALWCHYASIHWPCSEPSSRLLGNCTITSLKLSFGFQHSLNSILHYNKITSTFIKNINILLGTNYIVVHHSWCLIRGSIHITILDNYDLFSITQHILFPEIWYYRLHSY